jgi:amidase
LAGPEQRTRHDAQAAFAAARARAGTTPPVDDRLRESAVALVRDIRAGKLDPVELVEASMARIDELDPAINAICTVASDARAQAERVRDALQHGRRVGPLAGLPVGIKDITSTAGLRTTHGSRLFADHVPDTDARVVARLRAAGAVILAKTNTPEMAMGAVTNNALFGPTRNPWNVSYTPGGSTGGGAAALATGMIALAQGTDLGGSLRVPAAYSGVVGLRPSPGLVPIGPAPHPWDDLQVTGPMARTVADVALMLQALAGPSPAEPMGRSAAGRDFVAAAERPLAPGLHVGFCPDLTGRGIEPELVALARQAVARLADRGAIVEEIDLDLSSGHETFVTLRGLWVLAHFGHLLDDIDQMGENLANNLRLGLELGPMQIARAMQERGRIFDKVRAVLEDVDVLITPTVAVPPFRIEDGPPRAISGHPMVTYIDWIAPTYLLSLTSLPVLAVPCGRDGRGMPAGVQILGPVDAEESILTVGAALEACVPPAFPELAPLRAAAQAAASPTSPPPPATSPGSRRGA